ncbi:LacI family DNA-binding transcriptional regulator [Falsihalocynthiibacter sp. SS001]|uniref:LacI family DNA-binding transcriptional regulator n=1 Tax=Falsihalocynthiibacter sp. SS001 TaxID=3349698 RepID=UPI0036D3D2BC
MNTPKARIQDVAKVAGVSTATVSRTLSNPSVVSETTRTAVLEAVKATGYRVNRAARNLRTQKTGAILVLIPNLSNPFFSQIISGVEQIFRRAGYSLLVADTDNINDPDFRLVDVFEDGQADGIILLDGYVPMSAITSLQGTEAENLVVYACEWAETEGIPSIRSDNPAGARMAAQHFASLGHKKVGHICGPKENVLTPMRRDAFVTEARKLGMEVRDEWIFPGDFRLVTGAQAADMFLALEERPTAVFSASDLMAVGFMKRLLSEGVRIPDDVSIIGFDDVGIAAYFHPSLTTIRQDRPQIGRVAATTLLSRLRDPSNVDPYFRHTVPVELITRESTAKPSDG